MGREALGASFLVIFVFFFVFAVLNSNFIVSLRFFMISMDIFMSFVSWEAKTSTKIEDEASSLIYIKILIVYATFNV